MIILSFTAGFVWVVFYKLLQAFRRLLGRGRVFCMAEDFLLAVVFAVSTYLFMYQTCGGLVRGYNYIVMLLGIISACVLFGRIRTAVIVRRVKKQMQQEDTAK